MRNRSDKQIFNEFVQQLSEQLPAPLPPAMPDPNAPVAGAAGGPPAPGAGGQNVPMDATQPQPEAEPLTPEGQVMLFDMIRQALAFVDHDAMSPDERSIFETKITQQNFAEMKDKIEGIFRSHINTGPAPAAENDPSDIG